MFKVQGKKLTTVHPKVTHHFFGRQGGVSKGIYNSLNAAYGSRDNKEYVNENLKRIAKTLNVPANKLMNLWQVHSKDCVYVSSDMALDEIREIKADGMVTDKAGIALGALSADCTSLLFAGTKADGSPVIGAAHSGWSGSLKGIGEAVVDNMISLGTQMDSIYVAIGPCIQQDSYEVSDSFKDPFLTRDAWAEDSFIPSVNKGHLMFDMPGYIAKRLKLKGIKHIEVTGHDTYAMEEEFFSYRRKTHRDESDYGRQISAIVIEE